MTTEPLLNDALRDEALRAFECVDETFTPQRLVFGKYGKLFALTMAMPFIAMAMHAAVAATRYNHEGFSNLLSIAALAPAAWASIAPFVLFIVLVLYARTMLSRGKEKVQSATLLARLERAHGPTPISIEQGGYTGVIPIDDERMLATRFRVVAALTPPLHETLTSFAPSISDGTCWHLVAHLLRSVIVTPRAIVPRHSTADPWSHIPSLHALHAYASQGVEAALDVLLSYSASDASNPRSIGADAATVARVATTALSFVDREIYRALDPDRRDRLMDALSDADSSARDALFDRVGSETVREDLQRWLRTGGATRAILHALAWLQRVHPTCVNEAAWRGEAIALLERTLRSEGARQDAWSLAVRLTGALEGPARIEELLPAMLPRYSGVSRSDFPLSFENLWRGATEIIDTLGAEHAKRLIDSRDSPLQTLVSLPFAHRDASYPSWKSAFQEIGKLASREALVMIATHVMRTLPVDHDVRSGGAAVLIDLANDFSLMNIRLSNLGQELKAREVRRRMRAIDKLATFPEGIDALEQEFPHVAELATIGYVAQALFPVDPDATSRILLACAQHAANVHDRIEAVRLVGDVGTLAAIPVLHALARAQVRLRDAVDRAVAQIQAREAAGASHGGLAIATQEDGALSIDHDAGSGLALESIATIAQSTRT